MTPDSSCRHVHPSRRIRVLLVDEIRLVREGLRRLLEGEDDLEVVEEAATVEEAMPLVARHRPDIVILSAGSRDDGPDATQHITTASPQTKVMLVAGREDNEMLIRVWQAGASGVLLRDSSKADLLRAIKAVHRGERVLDPSASWKVLDHLVHLIENGPPAGAKAVLTAREREVVQLLAAGRSNREIARCLFITPNTLKTHIRHIQRKLGTADRLQTVAYALRHGLVE